MRYAGLAADGAAKALAFERAADLYRSALALGGGTGGDERLLRESLGKVLANAGRGADAAEAFLGAAEGADALASLDLRRRAAEQYLRAGRAEQGIATLKEVLREVGLPYARTPTRALLSILLRRVQIRLRGLRFRERPASIIAPEVIARTDACWSASMALGLLDTIRGMDFQTRHLLLALRAGDPFRVARAVALEAAYVACAGTAARLRTASLVTVARDLAGRVGKPYVLAWAEAAVGMTAWLEGRFRDGHASCARAERLFQKRCVGAFWERSAQQLFSHWCLWYLGEFGEIRRGVERSLREAETRGDRFAEANFRTGLANVAWLAADDPEGALREADAAVARGQPSEFHIRHYWDLLARGNIAMYRGRGRDARDYLLSLWRPFSRSLNLQVQVNRVLAYEIRGRSALAAAAEAPAADRETLLRKAEVDARRVAREGLPQAAPLASLLRAGAASLRGRADEALRLLRVAIAGFDAAEMGIYAAVAGRRRGELTGGDEGHALIAGADDWMTGHGVRNPERMAATFAPGWPGAASTRRLRTGRP